MENTSPWMNTLLPKIFFSGKFIANVPTVNNRNSTFFEAKRFVDNDWLPEDFDYLL